MHVAAAGALADWELTRSGRALRTYGLRIGALSFAAFPVLLGWYSARNRTMSPAETLELVSLYLSSSISIFQVFVVMITAPILASTAFSDERQGGTLDLLIMTGTRWPSIVATKFISVFSQVVLLLLAILPFAAIGSLFGGMDVANLAGRTVAMVAISCVICSSGILASVWPRQREMTLMWTAGFVCLYVLISMIPDFMTGYMANTSASNVLGTRAVIPNAGGAPWQSLAMAFGVSAVYLLVALRLKPTGDPVAAGRDAGVQPKYAPDSPKKAIAELAKVLGVKSALPWTRTRLRLVLFLAALFIIGAALPGFSFFLYAFVAYSAAAIIHHLRRSGLLEIMRLVTSDRLLARLMIGLQLRHAIPYLILPIASTISTAVTAGAGPGLEFHIANAMMMAGFVLVLTAIASLLSTYRGGIALHTVLSYGGAYLVLIAIVVINQTTLFMVLGGLWMGIQQAFAAAIFFYVFARRFPAYVVG